ncbi:ankyrin repeat protein [Verticillium dahliae VdLs.17]|uniref:Ankyrin repeat protein n=2 Tax=Verticillium TaxID=1036719 RepID=G2X550_VERDV|nr:ankyrin repeat protein [Verticillium dahliae VdLs.17]EGY23844.1 ankyrin repeat protein [Verticillium dahliae VdLs.17]
MLDPFGIIGVVVVAGQIISTVANFGLDWKHAPADTKSLLVAVGALKTVLSETNMNMLLNDDFKDVFHGRHSTLLSQLGDTVPVTDTSMLVSACKKELEILLEDLQKRVQGHRIGWKRMKGAFLAKKTKEAVQNLHRQCQTLNTLMDMDALAIGVSIHKEVREARREQQGWHADKECKAIIDWLTMIDYGPKQSDFIARRQGGTGQWLLSSMEYREWSETADQTLFCPGIPGAGKTIITSIVVDDLCTRYRSNEHVGIAYIYCDFQRQQEQKVEEFLMSLLKQLTQGRSSLPECVKFLHDEHRRKRTRPSFDEVSRTLRHVADSYSRTFIIVDALDECQRNDGCRARFLTELFNLQAECGANIFATSRCIPEITDRFSASTILEIRANDEDVRRYLDGRILQSGRTLLEKCREEIRNEITEVSDGMNDLAKKVLSWITCAKRQLTTSEIQHALAIQEGDSELEEEGIPSVEDVVSVCVGLVETDEESSIIRLVHRTAQEYFQRIFPNVETDIAKVCLTYLSFDNFRNGFCLTGQDIRDQQLLDPFFEYAAQNWVLHARSASPDVHPLISTFLSSGSKVPSSCLLWAVKNQQELIAEWLLERRVDTNIRDADWETPLHHAVIHGWTRCVQLLLSYEATQLSNMTTDINNMTPIHYTVAKANEEIAQVFLDAGVSVDSLVKRRIWLATCQDGKLTYAPNSNLHCSQGGFNAPQGLTALHYAALTGSAQMTRYFLDHGANPNAVSECGETPLHLAVRQDIYDWKRPFGKRDR